MKALFMGTPDFAAACMTALIADGENIAAVVTQPDKPVGRGMRLTPSPVKVAALERGIPVYQPETLKDGAFADTLSEIAPDVIYVAAYGKILPEYVLSYPKYGCINAHASILPKYRGAAPIQRAIMDGESETGVTAMMMERGLDTGDMILCERVAITDEDDFETVHDKLCVAGGAALCRVAQILRSGEALPHTKQDDALSTYAEKITSDDTKINFSENAERLARRIRALSPVPLCRTTTKDGRGLKIVRAHVCKDAAVPPETPVGQVIALDSDGDGAIVVKAGDGAVAITSLRPEGKGTMSAADFIRGRRIEIGDVLGYNSTNA